MDSQNTISIGDKTRFRDAFRGLGQRMIALSVATIALMSGVIALSYLQVSQLNVKLHSLLTNTVPAVSNSMEIAEGLNALEASVWGLLASQDDAALASLEETYQSNEDKIASAVDIYKSYEMPERADKLRRDVIGEWGTVTPELEKGLALIKARKFKDFRQAFQKDIQPHFAQLRDHLSAIELNNVDIIETYRDDATKEARHMIFGGGLCAVALSILLSIWISLRIMRRFVALSDRLTQETLRTKEQSERISESANELSEAAAKAGGAITQITSSFSEMHSSMTHSDQKAKKSAEVTSGNASTVREGEASLAEIRRSVEGIKKANDEMVSVVDGSDRTWIQIVDFIDQIVKKTSVINDIVFQTKLLSFNASVEAARAGEHGKGFSVVAEEIGALARSSGDAAREIEMLLTSRKNEIVQLTTSTKKSLGGVSVNIREKIVLSMDCLNTSMERLQALSERSDEIKTLVTGISTAITEQTKAVSEINKAFYELDHISTTNLSRSKDLAQTAENGRQGAAALNGIVDELNTIVRGAA